MTNRLGDVRIWIVAAGVLIASEACSAMVTRSIPTLYVHWLIRPILGIANAPTDGAFLWTTGLIARLLHSGLIVVAAVTGVWVASKGGTSVRSGWYRLGLGLFIGGAAANAYQLLVSGSVLDWITFRPLAALGWHQGYPTYSLGDVAVAVAIAVLISVVLTKSQRLKFRTDKSGIGRPGH